MSGTMEPSNRSPKHLATRSGERALWRSTIVTAIIAAGMFALLSLLLLREWAPEWTWTDRRVTVLTVGRADSSSAPFMVGLDLDGRTIVQGAEAALGQGGAVALSWTEWRARDTPTLSVEPPRDWIGEPGIQKISLSPNGRECRVIVFMRHERIDVSACLSPVVRP
jgi:hypothetical protein